MINSSYTVYHLHDDTSNCNGYADSCSKYTEYIKLAKEQGMHALAFSNHGGIYDWINKKKACDNAKIKYIHGVELYVCDKLEDNTRGCHIGLYARNWDGVKELNSLVSISNSKGILENHTDRHMYYNPRISLDELMGTSSNIIVTTACLASPLNKWTQEPNTNHSAANKLVRWLANNKERCFLEVQYHNCENQINYNKMLYKISKKTGIRLIAGTDTHSSSNYKAECRIILQKYKDSYYGEEDEFDLVWKTYKELINAFELQNSIPYEAYMEAISNTNVLAEMVEDFTLDKKFKYPDLYGDDVRKKWSHLIHTSLKKKLSDNSLLLPSKIIKEMKKFESSGLSESYAPYTKRVYENALKMTDKEGLNQYLVRIKEEFEVMCKLGMESFMMFMSELINWCDENNIPHGTGRGSVCGSVIAFITNITDVDPVVWNTVFSRFCNEDRISLGDIDIDFAPEDREKVYNHIIEIFTPEKTSYIASFSTLQDRGCIDVLAGGLGYTDLDKIKVIKNKFEEYFSSYSKIIQEEVNSDDLVEEGVLDTTSISFDNHSIYMTRITNDTIKTKANNIINSYNSLILENQDLFHYLDGLKGVIVAKGTHPSGMIGSPITLADNLGVFYKDGDINMPVSTCAMKAVDSLNYVKFDILGLKTVGIIKDTCDYAGIDYPKACNVKWNDKKVWDNMIDVQQGVFQFEGDYAFSLLKDFKVTSINQMSMTNAALRPSGKSYRNRLIAGEVNKTPSEEIDKLLFENNGYLIFQEDTTKFLTDICDFSGSAADTTRRCLDENTMIMQSNGNYKKIKDIKIGDRVQSFNKFNTSEYKSVTNVFKNGIKDTYKVSTQHGYEVIGTDNHKVLTQRRWVRIGDLKTTDFIMTPKRINSEKDSLNPNQRLSESDMFLIGILIGDGTLGVDNNLHFTNSEIELIEKFKECVNKRTRNAKQCEFITLKQDGKDVDFIYSIYIKSQIYKQSLINLLNKLNLRKRAKYKHIPNEIMFYPKGGKLSNLLAGLFNTDGGHNMKSGMIEYYSNSKLLIEQIKVLLLKYNIYSYINQKWISEYNYFSYTLHIRQNKSLNTFNEEIIPFMIGQKKSQFSDIIKTSLNNPIRYNYILPNECKEEILKMSKMTNTSIRDIGNNIQNTSISDLTIHKSEFGITDTKAQSIVKNLYCPYTYELLFADYIPIRVKSIEHIGYRNVYDIEVEDNHNYVANGLIVHNCIGKKDIKGLDEQLPKILDGYCNHSSKERSVAEQEAKQFVQIIHDSSEYQFGYNHSTAYSMNGYECVMLRTYYTIEFVAAYLNRAEDKEDRKNGVLLAQHYGITINPIKFGKSSSTFTIDKSNNSIYKGIASIKYCNHQIANELHEISKHKYPDFISLLIAIKEKTTVDARQLKILITLNFFSDFGNNKYLLDVLNIYNKFIACKTIKKSKIEYLGLTEYLMKKYAHKETPAQFSQIDNIGLIKKLMSSLRNDCLPLLEQVKSEYEYLEYSDYKNESIDEDIYIVVDYNDKYPTTPRIILKNIKSGDTINTRIKRKKVYIEQPFGLWSILKVRTFTEEHKNRLNSNNEWEKTKELELILSEYILLKNNEDKR